jgi:long-chain acyl-CoA synthetase
MEWAVADFACLAIGAVDVPIYPTLIAEQIEFILRNSGARIIFVSTQKQFDKILSIQAKTSIDRIVVMDDIQHASAIAMSSIMRQGQSVADDPAFNAAARAISADDLATIIYTSGTTGVPKGVMLTHGNLASNLEQTAHTLAWKPGKVSISFLPLSHVTARHLDYLCIHRGVTLAYCPSIDELGKKLQQIRPQLFIGVPRVYEKVRQETERKTSRAVKNAVYNWALRVGERHRDQILAGNHPTDWQWKLANKLVYSAIYGYFGGRVEMFVSGGAPLGADLGRWFADMGMRILEGYGLTETSPVIAVNNPVDYKLGTVGKPLPNVECHIATDGELLVRGPSIFKGYWNNPEETAAVFDGDWFKTGDIGNIDEQGFLSITDRKKDLLKTSGGKFVAPQPIENKLKTFPVVGYPAVVGNTRKFVSVVISPNFVALEQWAREHDVAFQTHNDLVRHPQVVELYHQIIDEVNASLAQFEKLKKVLIVPDEFTVAAGEVTPTLKLKRRVIEQKYKQQIDALYAEGPHVSQPATV